jgi:hypothetical protein
MEFAVFLITREGTQRSDQTGTNPSMPRRLISITLMVWFLASASSPWLSRYASPLESRPPRVVKKPVPVKMRRVAVRGSAFLSPRSQGRGPHRENLSQLTSLIPRKSSKLKYGHSIVPAGTSAYLSASPPLRC